LISISTIFALAKHFEELIADHEYTLTYVEEMARIMLLMARADISLYLLEQLPSPLRSGSMPWASAWTRDAGSQAGSLLPVRRLVPEKREDQVTG
jgi:hypothetical protein